MSSSSTPVAEDDVALLLEEDLYSLAQQKAMTMIGSITALISFIGSSLILYSIWVDRKETLKRVYHRLLLGMSCVDSFSALGSVLFGGWGVTSGAANQVWARGTIATCNTLGFFLHMQMSTLCYSALLTVYFLLVIKFGKK
jgi:hypothetical protein